MTFTLMSGEVFFVMIRVNYNGNTVINTQRQHVSKYTNDKTITMHISQ